MGFPGAGKAILGFTGFSWAFFHQAFMCLHGVSWAFMGFQFNHWLSWAFLRFPEPNDEKQDMGKLVISVKNADITGKQLYDILLKKYHLQTEMATESYVLAMFTVGDSHEGYDRMTKALLEIDRSLGVSALSETDEEGNDFGTAEKKNAVEALPLSEAWDAKTEEILLHDAAGRYAGEFVNLYPPGIPVLVPGEKVTEELSSRMFRWLQQGLTVQGIEIREGKHLIRVLKNENGK